MSVWSPMITSIRPGLTALAKSISSPNWLDAAGDAADALVRDHDHGVGPALRRASAAYLLAAATPSVT